MTQALVGRTPWSARDALVPRCRPFTETETGKADQGVGRGPGGPPYQWKRRYAYDV
jgi:hypothetical protein